MPSTLIAPPAAGRTIHRTRGRPRSPDRSTSPHEQEGARADGCSP
jgi:hypothetical protein